MNFTDYVYSDLRARIAAGHKLPCRLTYLAMSQYYDISLTPVRSAVKRLVDDDYLICLDNGRLKVNVKPPKQGRKRAEAAPSRPVDPESGIRADLIRRSICGDTGFVREEAAAARYGIGRTVLRPILSRLAGHGLLEHVPRRGWRVRAFDKSDLRSFLEVREILELKALQLARPRMDVQALKRLLVENRAGELGTWNNNLHHYWIERSENRYIQDFFRNQAVYYSTLFNYAAPETNVVQEMAMQHCEILEALLADKLGLAKTALVRHIRSQKPTVLRLLDARRDSSVSRA